jgi:hypothetical protein
LRHAKSRLAAVFQAREAFGLGPLYVNNMLDAPLARPKKLTFPRRLSRRFGCN